MGMEGSVARWYDKITRRDLPEIRFLASRIAGLLARDSVVLEVAPGPGFLAIELARRGLDVRGIDISKTLLEIAERNAYGENVQPAFQRGNASALPLGDESVDFVVCRAAFKNFSEPVKALSEMKRVLRPGGTALLIDMRRDVTPAEIKNYVDRMGLGWFNRALMTLIFRYTLVPRAYALKDIERMAAEAGWSDVRIDGAPLGFEAWMKK
jgi:ubiquinone/menaquinone biosynthesis C-methylase UbiE